jgi:alcohol dehydrogenase
MQKVLTGTSQLSTLANYLQSKEVHRVLLLTGKHSYTASSVDSILEPHLSGFQVSKFHDFSNNPKIEDVTKGIQIFRRDECQAIIAVGGGSVLDMAKLIKAYQDFESDLASGVMRNDVGPCDTPLIALPTTAGSGSEATQFAGVYINNQKYSVSNKSLMPNLVFLVPEFTYSTSPYLCASTGMDALTQSIESFWSINSTETSINYSTEALGIIWKYLPLAVKQNDAAAKAEVMKAAHLAGKAINIAKTTAAHAISYSFTSYHAIPHGHAVALTIPFFCGYNSIVSDKDCNDKRGAKYVRSIFTQIQEIIGAEDLEQALTAFIASIGLELAIPASPEGAEHDVENILGNINAQRMKNNPRAVQNDVLRDMLKKIILKD